MAKVVKIKDPELQVTHKDCGAVIAYYPNELEEYNHQYYDGSSDLEYFLKCPNCGKKFKVK